ncbi:MAG: rod shape-determining protein RodA [Bacteroidales bacterium]|nr:rod shape-determining protein RodA [Bacteroidales bacterium]
MLQNRSKVKGFDTTLIVIYTLLVIFGWMAIFSSSVDPSHTTPFFNLDKPYCKQIIWIGVSVIMALALLTIDARIYMNYAYYIYAFFILLLIVVLFIGSEISGAKSWIKIGPFSLQPAEFAKFATALALAKFFNEGKTSSQKANQWIISLVMIFVPLILVLLQHDAGSALVYLSFIFLFYREGMSGNILLIGAASLGIFIITFCLNEIYAIAVILAVFIGFWIYNRRDKKKIIRNIIVAAFAIGLVFVINPAYEKLLEPHQKMRISTLFGKTVDPQGADFNLNQSKIAIGSGGFFGKGYLKGTQTKLDFVPEQSTDFIFCSVGEEFGFVGSMVIIGLFTWLVLRILFLADRHRIPFVRYYGYGVAAIIFFHYIINIGMTIGLVPIIGIPLPFLSYGGSSLWGFTTLLFIFIRLNEQ